MVQVMDNSAGQTDTKSTVADRSLRPVCKFNTNSPSREIKFGLNPQKTVIDVNIYGVFY